MNKAMKRSLSLVTDYIFSFAVLLALNTSVALSHSCQVKDQSGTLDISGCSQSSSKIRCYADTDFGDGRVQRIWGQGCYSSYSDCWFSGTGRVDPCVAPVPGYLPGSGAVQPTPNPGYLVNCKIKDQSGTSDLFGCRGQSGNIRCYADVTFENGQSQRFWGSQCERSFSDCWWNGQGRVQPCVDL